MNHPPYLTGTASLMCDCNATVSVSFDGIPPDELEDHILETAEAVYGWHRGLYCPSCSPQAIRDEELEAQAKEDRTDREDRIAGENC